MATNTPPSNLPNFRLPEGFDGPRACGPYELPGVLDLINLVLRTLNTPADAPPRWPTIGFDWSHLYHSGNLENVRIVVNEGRVVTSVAIYSTPVRTPRGELLVGGINGVATHPDFRRHGLATAALEDAHAKMRADGHQIALLSTESRDYYRKIGWEMAGQQWRFVLDRGNTGFLPESAGFDVVEEWRPHLVELTALHNAEALGAPRSEMIFGLLAERKFHRIFVALRDGRAIAYAGVNATTVNEHAGTADDVAALLRAVFDRLEGPARPTSGRPPGQRESLELTVVTPAVAEGVPGLLQRLGIPFTLSYQGMIKILEAQRLFDALALDARVEPAGSPAMGWRVHARNQQIDLTERQLVKLVFGPERFPGFGDDVFPVPFFQWPLDHV